MNRPTASHFNALLPCPCGCGIEPEIARTWLRDADGRVLEGAWDVWCLSCPHTLVPGRHRASPTIGGAVIAWNRHVRAIHERTRAPIYVSEPEEQYTLALESVAAHPALRDGFDIGGRGE